MGREAEEYFEVVRDAWSETWMWDVTLLNVFEDNALEVVNGKKMGSGTIMWGKERA